MNASRRTARTGAWTAVALILSTSPDAAELRGQADLGVAAATDATNSFDGGLGKSPYSGTTALARFALRGDAELGGDFIGRIILDADVQRSNTVGIQEAWVGWHPIPEGPWRTRVRAGAFFPETSLETGYDTATWSAERTFSASAVNTWIGQEIRANGVEVALLRRGLLAGSPHTYGASAGLFTGNDPAGTLIAWQGWNVSGGITGLGQHSRLPDLPVYRPDGSVPIQTRDVHLFRELDDRVGHYVIGHYAYAGWLDVAVMRYDNRADPLRIEGRQYGWHTRFDHASLKLRLPSRWELLAQGLRGETLMGPSAIRVGFTAWYVLASHPLGRGLLTLRHDDFDTTDRDLTPVDPNDERGRALAIAYAHPLAPNVKLIAEGLEVTSRRTARQLLGEPARLAETSLSLILCWSF